MGRSLYRKSNPCRFNHYGLGLWRAGIKLNVPNTDVASKKAHHRQ
jgi:hypothetical protein